MPVQQKSFTHLRIIFAHRIKFNCNAGRWISSRLSRNYIESHYYPPDVIRFKCMAVLAGGSVRQCGSVAVCGSLCAAVGDRGA
jgi:hypothetical protein